MLGKRENVKIVVGGVIISGSITEARQEDR
jgi:hypothetical protein